MNFKDNDHKLNYEATINMMKSTDCYHQSVAYLLSLDDVCFKHINDIFDFADNSIKTEALYQAWHTRISRKTTRLAFNLYNGYCTDGETYIGSDGFEEYLPSAYFTPVNIFCCEYAPYYIEAVKMRFPQYTGD